MHVELMAGATLHLATTARLDINKALLTTLTGSYFCVSERAQITRTGGGNFVTEPGTNLGIGPNLGMNINITPAPT